MIRWSYLFFALIGSFSLMVASIFSESFRFAQINALQSPFDEIPTFSENNFSRSPVQTYFLHKNFLVERETENTTLISHPWGLELANGEAIISTKFSLQSEGFTVPERPFKVPHEENYSGSSHWIKVGPLWIDLFQSSILVHRNNAKNSTHIETTDHQVAVYFEGAKSPVILPAGSQATIMDNFVSQKTNLLAFSKLKKEWKILPVEPNISLQKFQIFAKSIFRKSKYFAQDLPKSWMWGEPGSAISQIVQSVKKAQSIYAIGFTEEMEQERIFSEFIQPFLEAQNALYKDPKVVEEKLREVAVKIQSDQWKNLIKDSEVQAMRWNELKFYQNIWLQDSLKGSEEWPFRLFWKNISDKSGMWEQQILLGFLDLERLIFNQDFLEVFQQIDFIQQKISTYSQELSPASQEIISRIRRQTFYIIQNHDDLKDVRLYAFYRALIVREIQNKSQKKITEISLENAQDILFLTQKLLSTEGNQDYLDILIDTYNQIDVIKIQRKLGRNIFSSKELETIRLIKSLGKTGLTPEELEKIKK
jgi:hypothetical protein